MSGSWDMPNVLNLQDTLNMNYDNSATMFLTGSDIVAKHVTQCTTIITDRMVTNVSTPIDLLVTTNRRQFAVEEIAPSGILGFNKVSKQFVLLVNHIKLNFVIVIKNEIKNDILSRKRKQKETYEKKLNC